MLFTKIAVIPAISHEELCLYMHDQFIFVSFSWLVLFVAISANTISGMLPVVWEYLEKNNKGLWYFPIAFVYSAWQDNYLIHDKAINFVRKFFVLCGFSLFSWLMGFAPFYMIGLAGFERYVLGICGTVWLLYEMVSVFQNINNSEINLMPFLRAVFAATMNKYFGTNITVNDIKIVKHKEAKDDGKDDR